MFKKYSEYINTSRWTNSGQKDEEKWAKNKNAFFQCSSSSGLKCKGLVEVGGGGDQVVDVGEVL